MDVERWQRISELYHAARLQELPNRIRFVRELSGTDEILRLEVEALLAADGAAEKFLNTRASEATAELLTHAQDALLIGRQLGAYCVEALLGAGGMGEVYRARDTTLGRNVALKVLPAMFAADRDRLARFEREARMLAALNHPHIGTIYGVEEHDGIRVLVLELVEGATLAERLARGPLPLGEALDIARQVSEALEAAHERAIVHRDLKPANISITLDGIAKVLDFGLAKIVGIESALAVTASVAVEAGGTRVGMIAGTAAYMSPEQARGKPVDKRSDIWSFGCVLYEMLTSRVAFPEAKPSTTVGAIREREPDWTALPESTPPDIRQLLRRCLDQDPKARLRDIGEARIVLEAKPQVSPRLVTRRRLTRALAFVGVAMATLTAGVALIYSTRPLVITSSPQEIVFQTKTNEPQTIFNARFAPDREAIIFSAALVGNEPELFESRPGIAAPKALGINAHLLSVSSKGELAILINPTFIQHRLFRGTLARMAMDGAPRAWMEDVREADWSPDASTVAAIRDDGRQDRLEYPLGTVLHQTNGYLSDPRVSPDGHHVAFFEHPFRFDDRGWLKVVDRKAVVQTLAGEYWGEQGIAWAPDGQTIVYSAAEAGWDSFFPRAVSLSGTVPSRVALPNAGAVFLNDIAVTSRWLVTRTDDYRSARVSLPGDPTERDFSWLGAISGGGLYLSPDRSLILFGDNSQSAGINYAVAIRKVDGSPAIRLGEGYPAGFSPDGMQVLAATFQPPQVLIYPVGSGEPIHLDTAPLSHVVPRGWLPDGKRVILCGNEPSRVYRCYVQTIAGGPPTPLTPDGFDVGPISPDGRRIVMIGANQSTQLLWLADGTRTDIRGIAATDTIAGWGENGRTLFVHKAAEIPARVEQLDLATGRRTFFKEMAPPDRAGLMAVRDVRMFDAGRGYTYTYWKRMSRLVTVDGVSLSRNLR